MKEKVAKIIAITFVSGHTVYVDPAVYDYHFDERNGYFIAKSDSECLIYPLNNVEEVKVVYEEEPEEELEEAPQEISDVKILDILDWSDGTTLSVRSINALRRSGYLTLGDLAKASKKDIMKIRNIGKASFAEIIRFLQVLGIELSEE